MPQPHADAWFFDSSSMDAGAIAAAATLLPADERARADRFVFDRDRRDYIAAHALLRTALSPRDGRQPAALTFTADARGKPWLVDAGGAASRWMFSLSHTHGMVACAVTESADIGVDVERIDRDVNVHDIAARFFAEAEIAPLMALEADRQRRRFFELWTLKEALLKATGLGLASSLRAIAFSVDDDGRIVFDSSGEIERGAWQFATFQPGERCQGAVAVARADGGAAEIRVRPAATPWPASR